VKIRNRRVVSRKVADKQDVAEMLKASRERAGMTQQELASKLGLDRSTIAKVESGAIQYPTYKLVRDWCAATNGLDLMSIDFTGNADGWKKLRKLETFVAQLKAGMDAVNFLRRRKCDVGTKLGRVRGRL
jgi:transcriptional regulator with XRE-family HTH domain